MQKRGNSRGGEKGEGSPKKAGSRKAKRSLAARGPRAPAKRGWGRALDARQLSPRRRGGRPGRPGVGNRGEGGTRTAAACGSEAVVSWGAGTWGRRPRSAASQRPRPSPCRCEAFKDTSAPARRGACACVRVLECARGEAAAGTTPASPPARFPARCSHPRVFRPPRPGIFARPRPTPPPHCGAATTTTTAATAAPAPTARSGGREEPATTPPSRRTARPSARRCAPQVGTLPIHRPSQIRRRPAPPATGGRRRIAAQRSQARPPDHPSARLRGPLGYPAPPGRGGPGAGGRGGGPGRARLPFSAAAAEPARGPAPAPSPLPGPAAGAEGSGSGSAPSRALAAGPMQGPEAGAEPGRRGRPGRAPAAALSRARRPRQAAEGPPQHCIDLNLSPEPARAGRGVRARSWQDGRGRLPSPGDINKPSAPSRRPASAARRLRPQPRPRGRRAPSCRGPGARPEPGTARRGAPSRLPAPRPPGPACGPPAAALITVWRVGSRRPGCAPWCRGAASRLVLCSRRRRRPRASSLPARPPARLARSLPPLAVALPLSASSAGFPSHPFSPPSSFPPSGRPPAQASARRSPPAAALAPAPAMRSRPGGSAGWGPRGAAAGAAWRAAGPSALGRLRGLCGPPGVPARRQPEGRTPRSPAVPRTWTPLPAALPAAPGPSGGRQPGPCRSLPTPRGTPRYLALLLRWVPASSTGRRDSGPSSPRPVSSASPRSPRSPRRPSPCSSPDLRQSPLHSARLSTGAGDSSAGRSAPHPPARYRPNVAGPRLGAKVGAPGGLEARSTSVHGAEKLPGPCLPQCRPAACRATLNWGAQANEFGEDNPEADLS
ncbi:basic proline-rich protein-like isoform X2 [Cavia porcellus]|uniref:basic proline-rich protein-like isoform X2 n=1 Tax=Cavia porcellus TaxID=10141 RepID=UPI002FE33964